MSVNQKVHNFSGYEAAQSRAAFFIHSNPGWVRIAGEDRLDFIQRQTTNDTRTLAPGKFLQTVLISPTARILDVLYVFTDETDILNLVTLPGNGEKTFNYLKKRIFFNDKVVITDFSHEFTQADIEGPDAGEALLKIGIEAPAEVGRVFGGKLEGNRLEILSKPGLSHFGYRILIRTEYLPSLLEVLTSVGVVRVTDQEFEILRVESGIPAVNRELFEDYTPLEVNLSEAISNNKGCYTGQEVIARQINYDKITKRLVGLHLNETVPFGAKVYISGKSVGEVTSIVESPRFGFIAMAVIKRPYFEPGTQVEASSEQKMINGIVCELPFVGR